MAEMKKPKKAKGGPPKSFTEGLGTPGGKHTPGEKAKRAAQTTDSNNG